MAYEPRTVKSDNLPRERKQSNLVPIQAIGLVLAYV
ncbi:hypothetical protein SAMN05421827_102236 [Pedobacter terrae]|uniref:Uncharacterized protein n=1 Tax=Pedobacter terrae TaxID=405671 RepID=A0A1G7QAF4_9SPHI|nr:hypothetical protein SAMN05421827_102236 [Pedobacter terrae]